MGSRRVKPHLHHAMGRDAAGRSLESQASLCFILEKLSLELRMPTACRSLDHGRAELPWESGLTKSGLAISDPTTRNSKYGKRMSVGRGKCSARSQETCIPVPAPS